MAATLSAARKSPSYHDQYAAGRETSTVHLPRKKNRKPRIGKTARKQGWYPPHIKTPLERLEWLGGKEVEEMVQSGVLAYSRVRAEERRIEKELNKLRPIVPSPLRLEEHGRGFPFPPKADDPTLQMRTAREMLLPSIEKNILWPAIWLTAAGKTFDLQCFEHYKAQERTGERGGSRNLAIQGDVTTSSPTAATLDLMRRTNMRFIETKLETESKAVLKEKIKRFEAGDTTVFQVDF